VSIGQLREPAIQIDGGYFLRIHPFRRKGRQNAKLPATATSIPAAGSGTTATLAAPPPESVWPKRDFQTL
jgi:hypothetical protein